MGKDCTLVVTMKTSVLVLGVMGSLPFTTAFPPLPGNLFGRAQSAATTSPSAPPTKSHPTSQAHTSFHGTPTVTGAVTASSIGTGISSGKIAPSATTYPSDGKLHNAQPAPYVPAGGVGTNGTIPVYNAKSDFDYESLVWTYTRPSNQIPILILTT